MWRVPCVDSGFDFGVDIDLCIVTDQALIQRNMISQIEERLVPYTRNRSSGFVLKYAISFEWILTAKSRLRRLPLTAIFVLSVIIPQAYLAAERHPFAA